VLKCCNRLTLTTLRLFSLRGPSLTRPVTSPALTSALQALGRSWRPDASLVDGSSPHMQHAYKTYGRVVTGWDPPPPAGWHLRLSDLECSRALLAMLPQGLTHLVLR
jgi:hypothetical protein